MQPCQTHAKLPVPTLSHASPTTGGPTHLVLLLGRQRLHVALPRAQLEAKQRRQHALLPRWLCPLLQLKRSSAGAADRRRAHGCWAERVQ